MNDVWILNLDTLTWQLVATSAKPLPPVGGGKFDEIEPAVTETEPLLGLSKDDSRPGSTAALPPSAGHVLVTWGSNLLCIGGHTKAGTYSQLRKVFTGWLPTLLTRWLRSNSRRMHHGKPLLLLQGMHCTVMQHFGVQIQLLLETF